MDTRMKRMQEILRIEHEITNLRLQQNAILVAGIRAIQALSEVTSQYSIRIRVEPGGDNATPDVCIIHDERNYLTDAETLGKIQDLLDDFEFVFCGQAGTAELKPGDTVITLET